MDHLLPHKGRIEGHLFNRLATLFNLDVSVVFYDTTLAYLRRQERRASALPRRGVINECGNSPAER